MNLIQRIFNPVISRKINGTVFPDPTGDAEANISENVFIDNEPPMPGEGLAVQENHISAFLGRDFFHIGQNDGYRYHSHDMLENKSVSIKADFMLVLDKEIEEKRKMLLQLSEQRMEVNRISGTITEKIDYRIAELGKSIERYELEKQLAGEQMGWVMKPIGEYREGFLRGLNDYYEARNFGNKFGLFI